MHSCQQEPCVIRQRLALKINYWLTYLRKFRKILVRFLIKKELVLLILMEVSRSRDFCCWYKSLFQSLDFAWLYTNWLSTKLFQQYVLQLSSAITRLYPFSHQNTFFTSTNAIFNIITYTHSFCTCNQTPQPPLKAGIQGNNLYIFLWYPKSKFL